MGSLDVCLIYPHYFTFISLVPTRDSAVSVLLGMEAWTQDRGLGSMPWFAGRMMCAYRTCSTTRCLYTRYHPSTEARGSVSIQPRHKSVQVLSMHEK